MAATTLGVSVNPFTVPQFGAQSIQPPAIGLNPYAAQSLQQIQQLLQIVPQQLQQLQQLQYLQQYQLQQLQQVLQFIPAQLAQLQLSGYALHPTQPTFGSAGITALPLWSASPQLLGTQPNYVM